MAHPAASRTLASGPVWQYNAGGEGERVFGVVTRRMSAPARIRWSVATRSGFLRLRSGQALAPCWTGPISDRADRGSGDIHIEVPRVEACSASRTKSCRTSGRANRRTCSPRTGLFLKNRRHPGAGGGGAREAAASLRGHGADVERGRPCICRGWASGGAGSLPGGRRPCLNLAQVSKSLLRAAMQQRPEGTRMSARAYDELSWGSLLPEAGADDCGPFVILWAGLAGATRSEGTGGIETAQLAEAIQYRPRRQM